MITRLGLDKTFPKRSPRRKSYRTRSASEKKKHAAAERKRYQTLKNGLIRAIASANGMVVPICTIRNGEFLQCGNDGPFEIDHRYFSRFTQRKLNSVQRLERFAIEFIQWQGGDDKKELRLACRSCNAKHQPKRVRHGSM